MAFGFRTILRLFRPPTIASTNKDSDHKDFQMEIFREQLRQSAANFDMYQLRFKISLFATFANTLAGLIGASLFLTGRIPEGTLATYVSALSGTCFYQTSREAEERAAQAKKQMEKAIKESESKG